MNLHAKVFCLFTLFLAQSAASIPYQEISKGSIQGIPGATISGRIFDTAQRPVARIRVLLLKSNYDAIGNRHLRSVATNTTNDRGDYDIPSVQPGRYYLVAGLPEPPRSRTQNRGRGSAAADVDLTHSITYYPGVVALDDAVPIEVQPGRDVAKIDFNVYSRETHTLSGRLMDSTTGQQPDAVAMMLQSETFPEELILIGRDVNYDADTGDFEIHNVAPGDYRIHAVILGKGHSEPGGLASEASISVDVSNADITNLELKAVRPARITGRVTVDGGELQTLTDFEHIRVDLIDSHALRQSGQLGSKGEFQIDNVPEGQYQVIVCLGFGTDNGGCARSTPNFYLKYAAFGTSDVLNTALSFDGTTDSMLNIVLSPNPARIQGKAVNDKGEPMAHAKLVLIPEHDRHSIGLYRFATSREDGAFSIPGIAPGAYKLFAWEDLEENAYFDPDLLRAAEVQGQPVRVADGEQLGLDIKVIPASSPGVY